MSFALRTPRALRASRAVPRICLAVLCSFFMAAAAVLAEDYGEPGAYRPYEGQPGQDTPWVPTPDVTVQAMLELADVTPDDYVIDLGSGDGRMVIAAAKMGIRGHGVEFNPELVAYANRRAQEAGVADRAHFVQGDMFTADISRATVLPLFLLDENLDKLAPTFLALRPGTRIVLNYYTVAGWDPDASVVAEGDCGEWCEVHMYVVPARVGGTWHLGDADLVLQQRFQKVAGTLGGVPIEAGRLRGAEIAFTAGGIRYTGRVSGDTMTGEAEGARTGRWTAIRKGR